MSARKSIDENFIHATFSLANSYSAEIVKILGSRGNFETVAKWLQDSKNFPSTPSSCEK